MRKTYLNVELTEDAMNQLTERNREVFDRLSQIPETFEQKYAPIVEKEGLTLRAHLGQDATGWPRIDARIHPNTAELNTDLEDKMRGEILPQRHGRYTVRVQFVHYRLSTQKGE